MASGNVYASSSVRPAAAHSCPPNPQCLQRVLFIHAREPMWVPEVRWSALLADLELVAARGPRLR